MRLLPILLVIAAAVLAGCSPSEGSSAAPLCVDTGVDPTRCTPAFEPTYDALYTNTFRPSCAAPGVSCHAKAGRQGDVDFGDAESGYRSLTRGKLTAGKPECSVVVQRVIATNGEIRMPPGRSLSAGEQCAIVKWIADGAER